MITLDTNVVLRVLVNDDPEQCARAVAAWQRAIEHGGVFLPTIVLVEVAWVLRVSCKCDRAMILTKLGHLIDSVGVSLENEGLIRAALASYGSGTSDFSDCVIRESAITAKAMPVWTFDERFARLPQVEIVAI